MGATRGSGTSDVQSAAGVRLAAAVGAGRSVVGVAARRSTARKAGSRTGRDGSTLSLRDVLWVEVRWGLGAQAKSELG